MRIGDLVRIKTSFSRKSIGKLAIIVERWCAWNAKIHIIDTGVEAEWDTRKLEVVCE